MRSFKRNACAVRIAHDDYVPGFPSLTFPASRKGFTQIDYIIATGIFLVVFALVVQYVSNYFADVTATTNIRIMTTEANDLLSIAEKSPIPEAWPYFTPNDSVLLYMHLDNSTLDSSRYGNNGVEQSGVNCSANVLGRFDGACSFDGIDDCINASNSPTLNVSIGNFTVSAWVKTTASAGSAYMTVMIKGAGGLGQRRYVLQMDGNDGPVLNRARLTIDDDGVGDIAFVAGNTSINDGVWHHWVGMRDGNSLRLYVDGVEASNPTNITGYGNIDDTEPFAIGGSNNADSSCNTAFWNGTIDDVIIWNRSLPADEIRQLYAYESTISRIGLVTSAYRFNIILNNSRPYWINQSKSWVNITDELVRFNYTDIGIPSRVASTVIYDDGGNILPYNINGNVITFNSSIAVNSTKNFTVYFDDDANFMERTSSIAGSDNLTERIMPAQRIDVVQYKKMIFLNNSNYTLIKNATQLPRDFRITLVDSLTSSTVFAFGGEPPPNGNIVATRRFVSYQNSTAALRRGSLSVQVW